MTKILQVAWREFVATVATKAFVIGVFIMPVIIGVVIYAMPRLMSEKAPAVRGEVAIHDPTGVVAPELIEYLRPEAIAERRGQLTRQIDEALPAAARGAAGEDPLALVFGEIPRLDVVVLPEGSDIEAEKAPLTEGELKSGQARLMLVDVHEDAVVNEDAEEPLGTYDVFVREKLDDRISREVRSGLRDIIVDQRLERSGLDPDAVQRLTRLGSVESRTVTAEGEKKTNEALNIFIPMGFMALLLVSVLTGGQYLLTSTIEEKSSRVVEVLLSAVSPMQLMTGKIIGQMAVGLVLLAIYAGMGIVGLAAFAVLGFIDLTLIVFLVVFYAIAYVTIASLMGAIGAAVNEVSEAQSLMTPIMLIMMLPWFLWLPIVRNPESTFATVLSFIPPINTFVMMARMSSVTPPPWWQVAGTIAVGLIGVYAALWFAAKVFRIGILMRGKPPSFGTLIRWVRMA